jgi:hypothetical protein
MIKLYWIYYKSIFLINLTLSLDLTFARFFFTSSPDPAEAVNGLFSLILSISLRK